MVTGYVPIPGHPRSAEQYGQWGEKFKELRDAGIAVHPFYNEPLDCWLYRHVVTLPYRVDNAVSDNPGKNSLAYHCVQHQKFSWLAAARILDHDSDVYVWMDYGIFGSISGVTVDLVRVFLDRVKKGDFAIPGCWNVVDKAKALDYPLEHPNWRFCGGVMVVPKDEVQKLFHAVRDEIKQIIEYHKIVTFEVNTLARCEAKGTIKPRWYLADHNQTMFTGY